VPVSIELFTDPACPFAFSAEPARQRLRWHYGDSLRWTVRMILLTDEPGEAEKLAKGDAGLAPGELTEWTRRPEVEDELRAGAAAARSPSEIARALDHKLGGPPEERRYTAPSYIIDGYVIPGFNPVEVYETAIANIAPGVPRRPKPESALDVLEWAPEPLATAEVATTMQLKIEHARADLRRVGRFEPAGADGYWTPEA
jgi:hypothetical protein